jgi:hypothetical protein
LLAEEVAPFIDDRDVGEFSLTGNFVGAQVRQLAPCASLNVLAANSWHGTQSIAQTPSATASQGYRWSARRGSHVGISVKPATATHGQPHWGP